MPAISTTAVVAAAGGLSGRSAAEFTAGRSHRRLGFGPQMQRLVPRRLAPAAVGRDVRARALWPFDKAAGGGGRDLYRERSDAANDDILIFFFQLDLATRVQYALNVEQYEVAKQLRNKLTEVEAEIVKQQDAKRGTTARSEVQDKSLTVLRLRADLQIAVENENYVSAASLRDAISKLEAESLAVAARALAYENTNFSFRLGQKVTHKLYGYQAVICGMDPVCCETATWMETAGVGFLHQGANQPFYQVLVDVHADPNLLVTYVAEENLIVAGQADKDKFDHPYASFLFYGTDAAGDFIPIKQLREKYSRPRYEVPSEPHDDNSEDRKS